MVLGTAAKPYDGLSHDVYLGLVSNGKEGIPDEFYEVQFAERFGWTLEYIRSLPYVDCQVIKQVLDAVHTYRMNKAK